MSAAPPALELRAIHKRYGTTQALSGATFAVDSGSLHVLLGENGAGKSTLLRVAVGLVRPDAGDVLVDGIAESDGAAGLTAGIGAVHQHSSLVPAMSVAENVVLADRAYLRRTSVAAAATRVRRIADSVGLRVAPDAIVGSLSVAEQQRTELIKALATEPRVLILDEPTAVLSPFDARQLFEWLRTFVKSGRAAVVITHRIREAIEHADAITVLRAGKTVLAGAAHTYSAAQIREAIFGSEAGTDVGVPSAVISSHAGNPVIRVTRVSVTDDRGAVLLRDASLSVASGEIVGVAGVDGSGHRELLRIIAGRLAPTSGGVHLPDAIGFVPEDRLRHALIGDLSPAENFALLGAGTRTGRMDWSSIANQVGRAVGHFDVRGGTSVESVGELSGGNQQRFVLARELGGPPDALIAENPGRGLDARAAAFVFDRLRRVAAEGAAVVVYSSDIDELLAIATRFVVCHAGSLFEVRGDHASIGAAMIGAPADGAS